MSGIGHLAAGFAGKAAAPKLPLWVILIASEINEILYFLFTAIGIEKQAIFSMDIIQGIQYITTAPNPWSHGLLMSVIWSLLAALICFVCYRDFKSSTVIGLVTFSHWILDFLMHSNLSLTFDGSPQVGIGLENSGPGFIFITILDICMLTGGIFIYLAYKKHVRQIKQGA